MKRNKDGKKINYRSYPFTDESIDIIKEKIKKVTGVNITSTEAIEMSINTISGMSAKNIVEELKSFTKKVDVFLSKRS